MAALTASTTITSRSRGLQEQVVVSGDTIYSGSLVGLGVGITPGYLVPWGTGDGTTAEIAFLGLAIITVFDTDSDVLDYAIVGDGTETCPVDTSGMWLKGLTDGTAISIASVGLPVFSPDDNPASITTTNTGAVDPIGTLMKLLSDADDTFDCCLFTPNEAYSMRNRTGL